MHKTSSPLSWRSSKERLKLFRDIENTRGTIDSFTIVYNAPKGFENNIPYTLALISLENGKKITSQIVDSKEVIIGMKVEPCLRRVSSDGEDGIIHYGIKFRVANEV